jgi:hypothetical protein
MTRLLKQAVEAVEKLPPDDQDAIAVLILDELQDKQGWGETLASSQDEPAPFVEEAPGDIRLRHASDTNSDEPGTVERTFDPYRLAKIMQLAVREALLRHKQAGNPIAVWRDGRVEWIQPEDIPVDGPEDRSAE